MDNNPWVHVLSCIDALLGEMEDITMCDIDLPEGFENLKDDISEMWRKISVMPLNKDVKYD